MKYVLSLILLLALDAAAIPSTEALTIVVKYANSGSNVDKISAIEVWRNIDNDGDADAAEDVIEKKWPNSTKGLKRYSKMNESEVKSEVKALVKKPEIGNLLDKSGVKVTVANNK